MPDRDEVSSPEASGQDEPTGLDAADPPAERLQRLAAVELGEHRERELYAAVCGQFVAGEGISRLVGVESLGTIEAKLLEARDEALALVEADRATFRDAILNHEQAVRQARVAQRRLIPLLLGVSAVVYVAIGLVVASVVSVTESVGGAALVAVLLLRFDSASLLAGYAQARQKRLAETRNLQAAEELFERALLRDAFPDFTRGLVRGPTRTPPDEPPAAPPDDADPLRLAPFEAEHLVEVYRAGQQLSTRARDRLQDLVDQLSGASVGIAGPRGAGKTTLMRWFFDKQVAERGNRALRISAPVRYEPRDFVLMAFSQLCEDVAGAREAPRLQPRRSQVLKSRGLASLGAALVGVGVVVYVVDLRIALSSQRIVGVGLMVAGVALLLAGLRLNATGPLAGPQYLSVPVIRASPPQETATRLLRDIRFQLTYSTGYSGKIAAGVAELGADASYSLAANQESLPEVVARFQAFLEALAEECGRVFIGIDELDKLPTADAVHFLDDVKGFFGTPKCFFLVSISEDALGQFERRGVPMRDTFDSAFDEVMRIEPLSCDESVLLLTRRGVSHSGLAALCHILSGGLPRDLIRQGRRLAILSRNSPTLQEAVTRLVASDLREKVDGIRIGAQSDSSGDNPTSPQHLPSLDGKTDPKSVLDALMTGDAGNPLTAAAGARAGGESDVAVQLGCLALIGETSCELTAFDRDGSLAALHKEADELAVARAEIARTPSAAWQRCCEVRQRCGLAPPGAEPTPPALPGDPAGLSV